MVSEIVWFTHITHKAILDNSRHALTPARRVLDNDITMTL